MRSLVGKILMVSSATMAIGITVAIASRMGTPGSALTGAATGVIAGAGSAGVVMGSSRRSDRRLQAQTQRSFVAYGNRIEKLEARAEASISDKKPLEALSQALNTLRSEFASRQEEAQKHFDSLDTTVSTLEKNSERRIENLNRRTQSLNDRFKTLKSIVNRKPDVLRDQARTEPGETKGENSRNAPSDSSPPLEEPKPVRQDIPEIRAWLAEHDIAVKGMADPDDLDSDLDDLANYIGDNYDRLEEVIRFIKTKVRGEDVVFHFYESEAEKIIFKRFGEKLARLSWFEFTESSIYSNRLLYKPLVPEGSRQELGDFFTSTWLERYAFIKTAEMLNAHNLHYEGVKNLRITGDWADQKQFELDVLYFVNGKPLWIECKAWRNPTAMVAELTKNLGKYRRIREKLGIPKEYALALVLNLSQNQDAALRRYQDFSVVQKSDFLISLQQIGTVLGNEVELSGGIPGLNGCVI